MIWYLLLTIVSGQPVLTPYTSQADACVAFASASAGSKVYRVEDGRKVAITEGNCLPVVEFRTK